MFCELSIYVSGFMLFILTFSGECLKFVKFPLLHKLGVIYSLKSISSDVSVLGHVSEKQI